MTDPKYQQRWPEGMPHHFLSEALMKHMMAVDWENGDQLCLKSGGDGDNGETLMYLMDGWFEARDTSQLDTPSSSS